MDHHNLKNYEPLDDHDDHDSTLLNRDHAEANIFSSILIEWLILIISCSIALFFFPLTPSFTLNSTSSSVLNFTGDNHFIADLNLGLQLDDSNSIGSKIYYDSLHVSLFHREEILSSFNLQVPFHQNEEHSSSKTSIEAKFNNVSFNVDEWGMYHNHGAHGSSCGFVYLDFWFSASARYIQPIWPPIWDKIQGNCGDVKVELCSSSGTVVVQSFLASCDVYSDLVYKVRVFLFVMLIFLIVISLAIPFIVEQFFCSQTFSAS